MKRVIETIKNEMLGVGYGNKKGNGKLRHGYGKKWIFNAASFFKKLWNTEVISKWT